MRDVVSHVIPGYRPRSGSVFSLLHSFSPFVLLSRFFFFFGIQLRPPCAIKKADRGRSYSIFVTVPSALLL